MVKNNCRCKLIRKARKTDALKTVLAGVVWDVLQLQVCHRGLIDPRTSDKDLELQIQRLVRLVPIVRVSFWH